MRTRKILKILLILLCLLALMAAALCAALAAKKVYYTFISEIRGVQARVSALERITSTTKNAYDFDYSWMDGRAPLIAHAGGGIDGHSYTNTREAFDANYAIGHRIFEVDFDLPDQDNMVCVHGEKKWRALTGAENTAAYTAQNVLSTPVYGQYRTMAYREIIDWLAQHPDAHLITDTKYDDCATVMMQFGMLVRYAEKTAPETLERIIPQIYQEEMLDWVMDIYPFRSVIFTLYKAQWTPESVLQFCMSTGVRFITIPDYHYKAETAQRWAQLGICTAVHTINDQAAAEGYFSDGTAMLYTDFLTPDVFPAQ